MDKIKQKRVAVGGVLLKYIISNKYKIIKLQKVIFNIIIPLTTENSDAPRMKNTQEKRKISCILTRALHHFI